MSPAAARGLARGPWRWRHLLAAPHRPGFLFAMGVLAAASVWWAGVQLQRSGALAPWPLVISPSLVHGTLMAFGFFPLFFAGFLFTGGPRWLRVPGPTPALLLPLLAAQALGWLLWLAGSYVHLVLAASGAALSCIGLAGVSLLFWRLIRASREPDRLHAQIIGIALLVGCLSLAGVTLLVLAGAGDAAQLLVLTGLWGCIVVVFIAAGHRMIPFFGSPPMEALARAGDTWMLWLLVGTAGFEAVAGWIDAAAGHQPLWQVVRAAIELVAGAVAIALAIAWAWALNLRIRLIAMLYLGFLWISFAFGLGGAARLIGLNAGSPVLPMAGLHALAMGGLGSLMLAMVTRVSVGHDGWAVVADDMAWILFWLLQAATVMRLLAAVQGAPMQDLLTAAALLWAGVVLSWGVRYGSGYGRPPISPRSR